MDERNSADCATCIHGSFDGKLKVYCSERERYYIYGCYISCDQYKKDKEKE